MLRILIVEDEEPINNLIYLNLKNEGYACQNLLGFGSIYDKQTGEVIFRIPYHQSIPLFCVYAGLICGGVIAAVWVIRRVCKESRSGNPAKGDLP